MSKRSEGTGERDHERESLRDTSHNAAHNPWRAFVNVAQIPEAGLHREIEADVAVREAMADLAGLREISSARASFDLTLDRRGRVHVAGTVRARVGQTCVVTLDPVESAIDPSERSCTLAEVPIRPEMCETAAKPMPRVRPARGASGGAARCMAR